MIGGERWRDIPGVWGYQVSSEGRVRSFRHTHRLELQAVPHLITNRRWTPRGPLLLVRDRGQASYHRIYLLPLVRELFGAADGVDPGSACGGCGAPAPLEDLVRFRGRTLCAACLTAEDPDVMRAHAEAHVWRSGRLGSAISDGG